ncbi:MaoC family dehydratase [Chloroflexota bacterium]
MAILTKYIHEGFEIIGNLKSVTQARINAFSGGFPKGEDWPRKTIHTDLEFAKSCGLPGHTASGAMFEGYLIELMIDSFGEEWLKMGKLNLKFIRIVSPGNTLIPKVVVRSQQEEDSGLRLILDVWCENQHGEKVVVGEASGIIKR